MGTAPMVPLPSNVEEIAEESNLGSLPAINSAEESMSRAVAVPSRKVQPDPSEEDHNFYHTVGSPTSVVDLFDLCSKSNWHNRQCNASCSPVVEDACMNAASNAQSMDLSSQSSKFQTLTQGDFMDCLTDDLVLHIMDFLDVKSAVLIFGPSSRRSRNLSRDWFPWRCMDLRHWLSLPNHRAKIWPVYSEALTASDARLDGTREDRLARRIRLSHFLGNAGLYKQGEELLSSALFDGADRETRADQLLALAYIRWRAQQARHGGDEGFLWGIVAAALESVELRRTLPGRHQARKLALALEVLAENAACYGHCLVAMAVEGLETGEAEREGARRVAAPFDLAEDAVRECVALWGALGDDEKLADAWAASAAVDFYAGRNLEGALAKLALAQAMCVGARRLLHPTHALVLFNLAYISLVAFGRAAEAAGLFARSLAVREAILGPEHPFTVATRSELVACLRLMREDAREGDVSSDDDASSASSGGGHGGGYGEGDAMSESSAASSPRAPMDAA